MVVAAAVVASNSKTTNKRICGCCCLTWCATTRKGSKSHDLLKDNFVRLQMSTMRSNTPYLKCAKRGSQRIAFSRPISWLHYAKVSGQRRHGLSTCCLNSSGWGIHMSHSNEHCREIKHKRKRAPLQVSSGSSRQMLDRINAASLTPPSPLLTIRIKIATMAKTKCSGIPRSISGQCSQCRLCILWEG